MGSRRGQLALAAGFVIAAVTASGAWGSSLRVLIKHTPNKTDSNRTARTINGIVIHDTEGRFIGSIRALQNPRVDGSAHFVVSRRGQIVQLVPVTDVAWHSGNSYWNLHSIGIEHEGWAGRRAYTEAEYRASAQLVAYLAHRWTVPIDRKHIIGHYQVPDPYHRGEFGGFAHHTDPGPYWNWGHYMHLVRYYAAHPVLPRFVKRMALHDSPSPSTQLVSATHAAPARPTVFTGAKVHGRAEWPSAVDWSRRWQRGIWKVEFFVDGKLAYVDHTYPFSFHRSIGWDSRTVANGRHMLSEKMFGRYHYRAWKRTPVRVANPPMRVRIAGAVSGGAVSGNLALSARVNQAADRVTLYADGKPVSRDSSAPFTLYWNTTTASEGAHQLLVYARDAHGHRAALQLPVIVANNPLFPSSLERNWVTHHVQMPVTFGGDPLER
jgi:N-acetyl-anhydromuramyl-L-alanine amidase AmpD